MTFVSRIRRLDGSEGKPESVVFTRGKQALLFNHSCPSSPTIVAHNTTLLRIDLSRLENGQRYARPPLSVSESKKEKGKMLRNNF